MIIINERVMRVKKIYLLIIPILIILITGCGAENQGEIKSNSIDEKKYDTSNFSYVSCKRDTETEDDTKVDIKYDVYYNKSKYLQVLKSYEKVSSTDKTVLKEYKDAYEEVYSVYDNLDYYDNVVTSDDDSVTSITYINYGKIDMDKLMEIEGSEDNVTVTDGKIKLDDWISFAKKYGVQCDTVA